MVGEWCQGLAVCVEPVRGRVRHSMTILQPDWPTAPHAALAPVLRKGQLLHPATLYYPFPRGKVHTRGNIWSLTVG